MTEREPLHPLMCLGCGFSYDEALSLPKHSSASGIRWSDVPKEWGCPDCGTPTKHLFKVVVLGYAEDEDANERRDPLVRMTESLQECRVYMIRSDRDAAFTPYSTARLGLGRSAPERPFRANRNGGRCA